MADQLPPVLALRPVNAQAPGVVPKIPAANRILLTAVDGESAAWVDPRDVQMGPDPIVVVPLSNWVTGGAWDFATVPGSHGDAQAASIPSLVGALSAVPTGTVKPRVFDCGAYGQRGLRFAGSSVNANTTALRIDALAAALFQGAPKPWCVAVQFRMEKQDGGMLWSANRSGDNSEYIRVSIFGQIITVAWQTTAGLITRSTNFLKDLFGDMIAIFELEDDGMLSISLQQAHAIDIVELTTERMSGFDTTPMSTGLSQFSVGCAFTSVQFNGFTGHVTRFYASVGMLGIVKRGGFVRSLLDASHVKRGASALRFATVGDSETEAVAAEPGSWRETLAALCYQRGLSYQSMAAGGASDFFGGVSDSGSTGNCFTSATSGTTIAQQLVTGLHDIQSAADAGAPLRFYTFFCGHGDCNAGVDPAVSTVAWAAAAAQLQSLGQSFDKKFRLVAFELYPIEPTVTVPGPAFNNVLVTAFNAALPAIVSAFASANPLNSMFFVQSNHALGGAWSAPFYADTGHLNPLGGAQVALHQTFGLFRAVDVTSQSFVSWLSTNSPSLPIPPPLVCAIDTPVAASSFNHANPLTVTGRCSRIAASLVLKNGSTVLAVVPTWTAMYVLDDTFGGSPQYHTEMTFTATIPGGMFTAGAVTLNATATDILDGTSANAAGVALTAT